MAGSEVPEGKGSKVAYHYLFSIGVVGEKGKGVGKSCLLTRFTDDVFQGDTPPNSHIMFNSRTIELEGKSFKLVIWDLNQTFAKMHAYIVAFDLTNRSSFDNVKLYLEEINRNASEKPVIVLTGLKSDLESKRTVTPDEAKSFAASLGLGYVETSAKENIGVNELFHLATKQAHKDLIWKSGLEKPKSILKAFVIPSGVPYSDDASKLLADVLRSSHIEYINKAFDPFYNTHILNRNISSDPALKAIWQMVRDYALAIIAQEKQELQPDQRRAYLANCLAMPLINRHIDPSLFHGFFISKFHTELVKTDAVDKILEWMKEIDAKVLSPSPRP